MQHETDTFLTIVSILCCCICKKMKLLFVAVIAVFAAPSAAFVSNPAFHASRAQTTELGAVNEKNEAMESLTRFAVASLIGFSLLGNPLSASADGQTGKFKLPPIDLADKTRCTLSSSSIGQANAARDKLYDLRQCSLSGASAPGFDLSGVIMTNTDVSKVNFREAYFSKGYLADSNFDGADFTNAIVDRANFRGSSLRGTIFQNAVLTGTNFENADLENADFTEAALGAFDLKTLCKNPTLKGENPKTGADTLLSVGCFQK